MASDTSPPDPLIESAARIADGSPVDWGALNGHAETALVGELELIERIADAHRKLHTLLPHARSVETGTLWGHIELIEEVGRGSYGIVYRALDTHLHREVALKLYLDGESALSAIAEGRHLARVDHPNVVRVFGADVHDGAAGIWMEFIRGQRLDTLVAERGALSAREAAGYGEEVARGLAAIHASGLLHHDVKAQNVMRAEGGRVVLMDLGGSRARGPAPTRDLSGTPLYMAPELFVGAQPSVQSDLYSLGVLLFFLVSGSFPVRADTLDGIRRAHAHGESRRLIELRPDVPSGFAGIVATALDQVPANRYRTAGEMAQALATVATPTAERRSWLRQLLPMSAMALLAALLVIAALVGRRQVPQPSAGTSIGVLPIRNLTGDPGKDYLADGLTEAVTATLARIPELRVPSSMATAPFRHVERPSSEIASELGVDLLLTGAVTQADSRIRLGVQLIEAGSGRLVWGHELLRTPATILGAQAEIAQTVAARLALSVPTAMGQRAAGSPSPEAQDAYLRGLVDVNSQSEARIANGIAHFTRAVMLDPSFAAAWAELSLAELRGIEAGDWRERAARAQDARDHALKAIELDPAHPTGYVALASVQYYHDWDFASAEATFERALEIAPSNAFARMRYAYLLAARGRVDEAIAQARQARDLEPLVPVRSTAVGIFRYYGRDYSGAMEEMHRALELSPGFIAAHYGLARALVALGRPDEAIAEIRKALQGGKNPAYLAGLAYAEAAAGRTESLAGTRAELDALARSGRRTSIDHFAYIAIAEGRYDDALPLLNEAVDRRMTNVLWLAVDPRVDPIREDPRFRALLEKLAIHSSR